MEEKHSLDGVLIDKRDLTLVLRLKAYIQLADKLQKEKEQARMNAMNKNP